MREKDYKVIRMVLELFALAFVLIFIVAIAFAKKIRSVERNSYRFYHNIGKNQVIGYNKIKEIFDRANFPPGQREANPIPSEERVQTMSQEQEVVLPEPPFPLTAIVVVIICLFYIIKLYSIKDHVLLFTFCTDRKRDKSVCGKNLALINSSI